MLILAALLAVPFLVCHLMGGREHVSVLAGTSFADSAGAQPGLAMAYVASYAVLVFVVPILAMAGSLFMLGERMWRKRTGRQRERPRQ